MPITIKPDNHQHWLQLRAEDITSTESAALFGLSPYSTAFELFHRKRDASVVSIEENERMRWGTRLQDAIAFGIAQDYNWRVTRMDDYMRHDTQRRMGSSFDFFVTCPERGEGVLEIKNVDFIQHRDKWIDDGENSEAPEHIELQLQHQLEVSGRAWGAIVALVGGNRPVVIIRERDVELGAKLCRTIEAFWKRVERNEAPEPDYAKDLDVIRKLYSDASGAPIVLPEDNRVISLLAKYKEGAALEKTGKELKDAAKAELLTVIGNSPKVICGNYTISAGTVNKAEYTVKATSYRDFRVNEKKR